jgi:hypothetical protein
MTNLSPAAQAVLDAATEGFWRSSFNSESNGVAAALRVASDWVVPPFINRPSTKTGLVKLNIKNRLSSLADELEGRDETTI